MGKHTNTIELNGRIYDVTTGKPAAHTKLATTPAHHASPKPKPKVMDGFFKKPTAHHSPQAARVQPKIITPSQRPKPTPAQAHTAPKPHAATIHHAQPATPKPNHKADVKTQPTVQRITPTHIRRHVPQKSKTLMRSIVAKPVLTSSTPQQERPVVSVVSHDEAKRLARAKHVAKSNLISRFPSYTAHSNFVKRTEPLKVAHAPAGHHKPAAHHAHPAVAAVTHQPIQVSSQIMAPHTPAVSSVSRGASPAEALFAKALQAAEPPVQAHPTKTTHRKKRLGMSAKKLNVGVAGLAAVLLMGFFAYQNVPMFNMQVATFKAGFDADMPGYRPAGFSVGPIASRPGQITITFNSNSDERNFNLTQKVSNWNSDALKENFLAAEDKTYQTLHENGRTIFMYDDASATWVNGGVWYQIDGNSVLNSDQLVRIASSL